MGNQNLKTGVYMAGRKIDDRSFWAGSGSKESVFPKGVHHKIEHSADGAGSIDMDYPDTTDKILRDQKMAQSKIREHKIKTGYRH